MINKLKKSKENDDIGEKYGRLQEDNVKTNVAEDSLPCGPNTTENKFKEIHVYQKKDGETRIIVNYLRNEPRTSTSHVEETRLKEDTIFVNKMGKLDDIFSFQIDKIDTDSSDANEDILSVPNIGFALSPVPGNKVDKAVDIHNAHKSADNSAGNNLEQIENDNSNLSQNTSFSSEGDLMRKKVLWGPRETLTLLGFMGISCAYAMRANLSVAIVAMVGSNATTAINTTDEYLACPYPAEAANETLDNEVGDFDWSEHHQGQVLASFYYGYIFTNFAGGRAAEKWGGKVVFGAGILATGVLTALSPIAAWVSGKLFVAVLIMEGIVQGFIFPAMHNLLSNWTLPAERSKYSSLIYSGEQFGTIVALIGSGSLCASDILGGWPSTFYVFGTMAVVWSGFWFFYVQNSPADCPNMLTPELNHLQPLISNTPLGNKVPWRSLLSSLPLWSILVVHTGSNWGFYTLLAGLPTYLDQIQHFSLASNGLLSAMPYMVMWIFTLVYCSFVDHATHTNKISILNIRRMSMAIAGYIPMVALIGMCFVNCNRAMAMVVITLAVGSSGSVYAGYISAHADIAPRYAATLMGLTNTAATIPGFLGPIVTGALTHDNQSLSAWRVVFLISAVIYAASTTFYLATASADIQPWNYYGMGSTKQLTEEKKPAEPNIDMEINSEITRH